jgi:argininosuccinate lyase
MRKGRFSKPASKLAERYSESVSFDWRLYQYDIAGSIAHAAALARRGILTADEQQKIENELRAIEREIESGKFEWDQALEDVHMNIEAALTRRIGAVGGKLHTARSRNDQIAARSSALCKSRDRGSVGPPAKFADRFARPF